MFDGGDLSSAIKATIAAGVSLYPSSLKELRDFVSFNFYLITIAYGCGCRLRCYKNIVIRPAVVPSMYLPPVDEEICLFYTQKK